MSSWVALYCACTHAEVVRATVAEETYDGVLEHLVDDGGQHALVVVLAELAVELHEVFGVGAVEDPQADVDGLEVCARTGERGREFRVGEGRSTARSGLGGDDLRVRHDVVDDGPLEPGHHEVPPLAVHVVEHAGEFIELDGAVARVDCRGGWRRGRVTCEDPVLVEHGGAEEERAEAASQGEVVPYVLHFYKFIISI